jgi:hypothetical protein
MAERRRATTPRARASDPEKARQAVADAKPPQLKSFSRLKGSRRSLLSVAKSVAPVRLPPLLLTLPCPTLFSRAMHTILLAAALPALVAAHRDAFGHHHARQATALAPATAATTPVPSVTLLSVNPTAVPLASIHPGTLSDLTTAAFATQTMGAVPTYMPSGAPGLPDSQDSTFFFSSTS